MSTIDIDRAGAAWLDGLTYSVKQAMSTQQHKLVRRADSPTDVGCICGQYSEPDHGEPAAELWREHLTNAAVIGLIEGLGQ